MYRMYWMRFRWIYWSRMCWVRFSRFRMGRVRFGRSRMSWVWLKGFICVFMLSPDMLEAGGVSRMPVGQTILGDTVGSAGGIDLRG